MQANTLDMLLSRPGASHSLRAVPSSAGLIFPAVDDVWHVLSLPGHLRHLPAPPRPGCALRAYAGRQQCLTPQQVCAAQGRQLAQQEACPGQSLKLVL